jgi:hypothetical protein
VVLAAGRRCYPDVYLVYRHFLGVQPPLFLIVFILLILLYLILFYLPSCIYFIIRSKVFLVIPSGVFFLWEMVL